MTEKKLSYQEKFTEKWIENDHGVLYGDEPYEKFLKSRKYYEENPTGDSYYRGLLCLNTGELYWLEFGTTGVIEKLIDVTCAKFYDDVDNETFILNLAVPLIGNRIRYVEPNRELLSKLFIILEDFTLLDNKRKEHKLSLKKPKKIVRSDIEAFYNMYRTRLTVDEDQDLILVEDEHSIILAVKFPYDEIQVYPKNAIYGMDLADYGFTINPSLMFKIPQPKQK